MASFYRASEPEPTRWSSAWWPRPSSEPASWLYCRTSRRRCNRQLRIKKPGGQSIDRPPGFIFLTDCKPLGLRAQNRHLGCLGQCELELLALGNLFDLAFHGPKWHDHVPRRRVPNL